MAVHDRPAAFEGADGFSYSVDILAERPETERGEWSAYLFFVQWSRIGASSPMGHLESDYLAHAGSEAEAIAALGEMRLSDVTTVLNELIVRRTGGVRVRRWWDAMRADDAS